MNFISALLFGISANIDTLTMGFTYGIRKQRIPFFTNILISFITFIGTFFSIGIGIQLTGFLPPKTSHIAGSLLLIILGSYYFLKFIIETHILKKQSQHIENTTNLSYKTILFLGLTLTVNNAGIGLGASLAGTGLLLTCFFTLILSFSFLFIGNCIGSRIPDGLFHHSADFLSGIIIIVMGIFHCFF